MYGRKDTERRHIPEARYHLAAMEELYDLVLDMVQIEYDTETRDRFAEWLQSIRPMAAHLAVKMVEMAVIGTPIDDEQLSLFGFTPEGRPLLK